MKTVMSGFESPGGHVVVHCPAGSVVKHLLGKEEMPGSIPGWGSQENGQAQTFRPGSSVGTERPSRKGEVVGSTPTRGSHDLRRCG